MSSATPHAAAADSAAAMDLVDIGANLAHDSFDADRTDVLDRAMRAGVSQIVVTGSDLTSAQAALNLAMAHPGRLFATAGLHPHHAGDWDGEHRERFRELAQAPQLVAMGECGLDYFRDFSPRPAQRQAFAAQLRLAIELGKPLFLHQRDAHDDFLAMLREHRAALAAVVVHCFTDTRDALADYLALDCHIGITGWICDERRGRHLIEAVRDIPANRLMLETDAPYLLPRTAPKAGTRRNEPALLPYVCAAVAEARGETGQAVAAASSAAARAFFNLPASPQTP